MIKSIYNDLCKKYKENEVQIVCPSGAACSVYDVERGPGKAKTVHHYFGIGLADKSYDSIIENTKETTCGKIQQLKVLIIDEISMMSARIFNLVSKLAMHCRGINQPFGGMQVIGVGDFYQLPPVADYIDPGQYAFLSPLFKPTFKHNVLLHTVYRQHQDDPELLDALNCIRVGNCDLKTAEFLKTLNRELPNKENVT
ncbi:uncharacterized protein LOC102804149 [Saccoglossus kowalevskii]|uniref:ATP-dependent DNA helicase n=1 Tax=Saccoglossus kowalevskii TaxID=10224 RepID=A0ABM0MSX8_SACKO|nr:PREDICTED: ATP-dependent DNA helicase PIF1-like [Saccoglossus kowalevskii]